MQWFLDDSLCADEDDIKFRADYFYGQRQYKQALDTYISLLNGKSATQQHEYSVYRLLIEILTAIFLSQFGSKLKQWKTGCI